MPEVPGLGLRQMVDAAQDSRLKAALIIGDTPNLSLTALGNLEFLVVHDTFLTPLAQQAQVVLPRVTFAEKDGTYTNLERRVQRVRPGLNPGEDSAKAESWIIAELARRLKAEGFQITTPSETMDEIARLAPIYGGISYSKLEAQGGLVLRTQFNSPQPTQVLYASKEELGLQWPCPDAGHAGTPTLYGGGLADNKAEPITSEFRRIESTGTQPDSNGQYPLWFVPGRVLLQQDRPMEIVKGKRNRIQREEWVEINPADGAEWAFEEGDKVTIETDRRRVPGVVRFSQSVPRGVAASTALFGQLAIDMQASEEFDPASRVPGLEIERARLLKSGAEQPAAAST